MSKAVKAVSSIFGDVAGVLGLKTPKMPGVPEPEVMPTADDEASRMARRRAAAEAQSRSGRASTILSQDETLG